MADPAGISSSRACAAGFTLLELVMVIVILSILAAAAVLRFTHLGSDAEVASVERTGAAFAAGIRTAHLRWVMNGPAAGNDDVAGFGDGTVDVHGNGYPVDTQGGNSIPNNATGAARCARVWDAVMTGAPSLSDGSETGFTAGTVTGNVCRYTHNGNPNLSITYAVVTGDVTVDSSP